MNNEDQAKELSDNYKAWLGRDCDCGFLPAMMEVDRLCEVIVGLREQCAGMEIREEDGNGIIIEQTAEIDRQARELEQLRAELRRAKGYPENPCTGAEFADAACQSIKPRSNEEIREIIDDLESR